MTNRLHTGKPKRSDIPTLAVLAAKAYEWEWRKAQVTPAELLNMPAWKVEAVKRWPFPDFGLTLAPRRCAAAILCATYGCAPKVAWAAIEREVHRDFLEVGVSLAGAFITERGEAFLAGWGIIFAVSEGVDAARRWLEDFEARDREMEAAQAAGGEP